MNIISEPMRHESVRMKRVAIQIGKPSWKTTLMKREIISTAVQKTLRTASASAALTTYACFNITLSWAIRFFLSSAVAAGSFVTM